MLRKLLPFSKVILLTLFIPKAYLAEAQSAHPLVITAGANQMMADAKSEAQLIQDAMISKNFQVIVDHTYPSALKAMGGKDNALASMTAAFKRGESLGIKLRSCTVGDASELVDTGKTVYVVLPEVLVVDTPHGAGKRTSFLLGISENRGSSWAFVDGTAGAAKIKEILPGVPASLQFPLGRKDAETAISAPGDASEAKPMTAGEFTLASHAWVTQFKGKTRAQVVALLGNNFTSDRWNSGNYGGAKLSFQLDEAEKLDLLLSRDDDERVLASVLTVSP
jgi:hypothetical protein